MIDWQRIAQLRDEIGVEDFEEVIELFLAEVEETLGALQDTPEAELEAMFHLLKGCALNLGFQGFADACLRAELAARNGDFAKVDRSAVKQIYVASRHDFLADAPA